jgi:hypothetical protein
MEEEPLFKTNTGKEDMNENLNELGLKKSANEQIVAAASERMERLPVESPGAPPFCQKKRKGGARSLLAS